MTAFLADIWEQPMRLSKCLAYQLGAGQQGIEKAARAAATAPHVYIAGIGSSWNAGLAVEHLFRLAGRQATLLDASEFIQYAKIACGSAVIVLSRSGKSVEIVELGQKLRKARAWIIGITNDPSSPLSEKADITIQLGTEPDHLVSVTMYSALALVGGLLSSAVLHERGELGKALLGLLSAAQDLLPHWQEQIEQSNWFAPEAMTYFLARGGSLASCYEAKLLWEEAAKAPASAMATGAFRHGSQEMLGENVRLVLWIDRAWMRSEDLALASDIRKLGARVMLIGPDLRPDSADLVLSVPSAPAGWQFLTDVIPAQLAAERLSRLRGVDCDSFRICPYIVEREGGLLAV
jgi:glucosamine--fructose-6-phosphate aminotransferase (isomerizing)